LGAADPRQAGDRIGEPGHSALDRVADERFLADA